MPATPAPPGRAWCSPLFGAIAFCGKAIIVKLAYRYGVDAVTLIMYRMLFALPLFALLAWWAGRGKPPLTRRDWIGVVGLGFSRLLPGELSRLCRAGLHQRQPRAADPVPQPDAGAAVRLVLFKRRVTRAPAAGAGRQLLRRAAGVRPRDHAGSAPNAALGAALVFVSAVSYAVYLVYSGEFVKRLGSLRLVGLATSVACVLCIAQFLVLRPLVALAVAPEVIWLSVLNATLCTSVPVLMVMMAIERIGAADGGANRHGRADVDDPDGRADPRRAVHRLDRGRHACW